jgi:hypothetical protein
VVLASCVDRDRRNPVKTANIVSIALRDSKLGFDSSKSHQSFNAFQPRLAEIVAFCLKGGWGRGLALKIVKTTPGKVGNFGMMLVSDGLLMR